MTARGLVPRLHVTTATAVLGAPDFIDRATDLIRSVSEQGTSVGVALHLRGRIGGRQTLEIAHALGPVAEEAGVVLMAHDRADVARIAALPGLHLPVRGFAVKTARALVAPATLLTASVHDVDEAAARIDADGWIAGNVWATASHPGRPAAGTELIRGLTALAHAPPVIAIGGVTPDRVREAVAAGAHGVAVLSGIWSDDSPAAAAIRYLEALSEAASGDPV